jgi:UrcA family protein
MAKLRYPVIATTLIAAALSVTPASAGERHRMVHYSDLDLSTETGQLKFKQRVNRAVRAVCAFPSVQTSAERADQLKCETRARTTAMRKAAQAIARYGGNVKVAVD